MLKNLEVQVICLPFFLFPTSSFLKSSFLLRVDCGRPSYFPLPLSSHHPFLLRVDCGR